MEEDNIDSVLQNALLTLLDIKPKDPVNFLATHFQMECETSNLIAKAVNMLQNMTVDHPALDERLLKVYSTISLYSEEEGLTGDIYTDLLAKLVIDIPQNDKEKFLSHMQCTASEYVSFTVFRSGILTCLLFNQYIDEAKSLFSTLCGENHDFALASTCRKALKKLSKSLNQSQKDQSKSHDTSLSSLSESSVSSRKSSLKSSAPREYVKIHAFLSDATDIFVLEIPKLK